MSLSPALKKRYGSKSSYTYAQVKTTIEELELGHKYSHFAYFVFCSDEEYEEFGLHLKEIKKYEGYRENYFGGACGASGTNYNNSGGDTGHAGGAEGSCGGGGE